MASNLEDSVRSERDSMVYDDVISQADLSKNSSTPDGQEKADTGTNVKGNEFVKMSGEKAAELTEESQKKGACEQSAAEKLKNVEGGKEEEKKDASSDVISKHNVDKTDDKESHKDKRRIRKDSDKEMWTPMKSDLSESKDSRHCDNSKTGDVMDKDSPDTHPTKPPRRHPQKKSEGAGSGELEQKTSPGHSSESDPIKPPRRRLPPTPKSGVTSSKPDLSKKTQLEGSSSASDDGLSVASDGSDQKPTEIVCKPVLTSSPNQDEIPTLSIETVDKKDTSRRVLSFIDESSEGGVRKVESFYDFLYSQEDINPVAEITSPILKEGDRMGSALSDSDDHLYDSVAVENSDAESFSRRSGFESYDEVIVNQGMNSCKIRREWT